MMMRPATRPPATMKFLDEAKVYIASGAGGNGCVAFRREKFIEFGGPSGGNGGKGGDVIVEAVDGLNTLIDYRYQQHFKAQRGHHGMGKNRSGGAGQSIVLKLPVGTQILDEDKATVIADLTRPGQHIVLLRGGDGGRGNAHFKSATHQAPRHAEPGWPGQERWVWLRLKLIADAGLVGLPNAGKSTMLAAVSRARPKIADYPFTTLHPQLGVVHVDAAEFVLADIPGLIEGAHEGAGLGDRFLGHVERCRVLIHLVDGTADDVAAAWHTVRGELSAYSPALADKPEILVLNKCDALDKAAIATRRKALAKAAGIAAGKVATVSGVAGTGVRDLLRRAAAAIEDARAADAEVAAAAEPAPPAPLLEWAEGGDAFDPVAAIEVAPATGRRRRR